MPSRPSGESPRSPMLAASASRWASVSTPPARRTSRFVAASASAGRPRSPRRCRRPRGAGRRRRTTRDGQAARERLGGAHRRVGEEHVHRPRPADRRGQRGGHAAVRGQPDRRVRGPQAGARAEHDEVAGERQRQPDARRPAVDGDDHGRGEVEQGPLTGVEGVGQLGEAAVGLGGEARRCRRRRRSSGPRRRSRRSGRPARGRTGPRPGTAGRTRGRPRCERRGSPAPAGTRRRPARPGSVRDRSPDASPLVQHGRG